MLEMTRAGRTGATGDEAEIDEGRFFVGVVRGVGSDASAVVYVQSQYQSRQNARMSSH